MIEIPEPQRVMRTYLSFPRGTRIPSPRILFYAGDDPAQARRDLALAAALTQEFATGSVVLATGSAEATRLPGTARVEIVKVPSLTPDAPARPLARERTRRLRQRLLSTLFDVFLPDLLLLDVAGPEAELEARLLIARARALEAATLLGVDHDGPGERCSSAEGGEVEEACKTCRRRIQEAAREALSKLQRRGMGS